MERVLKDKLVLKVFETRMQFQKFIKTVYYEKKSMNFKKCTKVSLSFNLIFTDFLKYSHMVCFQK